MLLTWSQEPEEPAVVESSPPLTTAEAGGVTDRLSLRAGWLWLGGLLGALLLFLGIGDGLSLYRRAPLPKSTPVLVDRAQEILKSIDYPLAGRMTGCCFGYQNVMAGAAPDSSAAQRRGLLSCRSTHFRWPR